MPRVHATALALLFAGLAAGCTRDDDAGPVRPDMGGGHGTIEWRGSLACSDCQAIDTRLVLERRGGERVYELVEVYVAVDGSVSFEETGEWRLDHALLSLEPDTGGLRRYALVQGGALQARDLRGRALPGHEGELLQPVGAQP
jgi:hypothetical protein